jgi:hypothetical protein
MTGHKKRRQRLFSTLSSGGEKMRRCASIPWGSHPIPDFRFRQLQFSPTPIQSANPSFALHFLSAPSSLSYY